MAAPVRGSDGCRQDDATSSSRGAAPDRDRPNGYDRRGVLIGGAALALGYSVLPPGSAQAAADKPERAKLQPGDRFHAVSGANEGEVLRPDMIVAGEAPVEAFPQEPKDGVVRDRNRLNRVLVLRLDPSQMDEETREHSADGVLIYSAICTHKMCTVALWKAEEQRLTCPCHSSEFAALSGGSPMNGPARRSLPMVPVGVDDEGMLIAAGDFNRKPGSG